MQYMYSTPNGTKRVVFADGIRNDRNVSKHFKQPVKYLSHKGLGTCGSFAIIKGGKSKGFDRLVLRFEKAQLKVPKGTADSIKDCYDLYSVIKHYGLDEVKLGAYLGVGKVHKKKKLIICK